MLKIEEKDSHKLPLKIFSALGLGISLYLLIVLLTQSLNIHIESHHIDYDIESYLNTLLYPRLAEYTTLFYIAVVCGSTLFSSDRFIQFFGGIVFLAALFSLNTFESSFISVWCFFAAVVSVMLYFYFKNQLRGIRKKSLT
jgi:hypothetical protein